MNFNLIIPMAGDGQRFKDAGYGLPKPFIDVNGVPMIVRVLENFKDLIQFCDKIVLICKSQHVLSLKDVIFNAPESFNHQLRSKVVIVPLHEKTEGAACTVLSAFFKSTYDLNNVPRYIDLDIPVIVANSDQLVDVDLMRFYFFNYRENSIMVFKETEGSTKWSYVDYKVCSNNKSVVSRVAEKTRISEYASVGIYLFKSGNDFVSASIQMIIDNQRTNNEFYLCPVYNYLIHGSGVTVFEIEQGQMHGLGTPEDLEIFLMSN